MANYSINTWERIQREALELNNDESQTSLDETQPIRRPIKAIPKIPKPIDAATSAPELPTTGAARLSPPEKMYPASFHGTPQDTQPLDTQEVRSYIDERKLALANRASRLGFGDEGSEDELAGYSHFDHTLQQDDTGYIDLVGGLASPSEPHHPLSQSLSQSQSQGGRSAKGTPVNTAALSDDELSGPSSPQTQFQLSTVVGGFTSQRPSDTSPLKTPAYAGQKRRHNGEIVSSTPGSGLSVFKNLKGGLHGTNGMVVPTLTQAFAASSPMLSNGIDFAKSDPVFERPSPNFQPHFRNSSPVFMSSPIKPDPASANGGKRASSDPRETYVSMRESQEQRKKRESSRPGSSDAMEPNESEDELSIEHRIARKRERARIQEGALQDWEAVAAPRRPSGRGGGRGRGRGRGRAGRVAPTYTTPARLAERDVINISDDADSSDDLADDDSEPGQGAQRRGPTTAGNASSRAPISRNEEDAEETQEPPESVPLPLIETSPRSRRKQPLRKSIAASQTVAVANSQPEDGTGLIRGPTTSQTQPSSASSRVPQSQPQISLSTSTKVDLDIQISANGTSSIPKPPSDTQVDENEELDDRIPSSPPLVRASDDIPDTQGTDAHSSLANDEIVQQHVAQLRNSALLDSQAPEEEPVQLTQDNGSRVQGHSSEDIAYASRMTLSHSIIPRIPCRTGSRDSIAVPETDPIAPVSPKLPTPVLATVSNNLDNLQADFETAPTHQSTSSDGHQPLLFAPSTSQSPKKRISSTRKRMSEIVAEQPPSQSGSQFFDVNDPTFRSVINDELVNKDDQDFLDAMSDSSPVRPAKRRRKVYGKTNKTLGARFMEELTSSALTKGPKKNTSKLEGDDISMEVEEQENSKMADAGPAIETAGEASKETMLEVPAVAQVETEKRLDETPLIGRETPQPVVARRSLRSTKVIEIAETPNVGYARPISRSRLQDETSATATSGRISHVYHREQSADPLVDNVEVQVGDVPEIRAETEGAKTVAFPNRVFAVFKGPKRAWYPAACLDEYTSGASACRIRFDDGTEDIVESHLVAKLELRINDAVKVDQTNMRSRTYLVRGFVNPHTPTTNNRTSRNKTMITSPKVDIYGHTTLLLAVKGQTTPPLTRSDDEDILEVPIERIYLTATMWPSMKDRVYSIPPEGFDVPAKLRGTPASLIRSMESPTTPLSRSRRPPLTAITSNLREGSFASSVSSPSADSGMFGGMAFAVSHSGNDVEHERLVRTLRKNGARVLDGFESLFNLTADMLGTSTTGAGTSASTTPSTRSPSRRQHKDIPPANGNPSRPGPSADIPLQLAPLASMFGFTALIANNYSRKAKHLQALALNLPILHPRWIEDSLRPSSGQQPVLQPWHKYLLPAGESSYLGGSIKSRSIVPYDARSAKLRTILEQREKLLAGGNVLLVTSSGSDRGTIKEKRKAGIFLTRALGADKVDSCSGWMEARQRLTTAANSGDQGVWNWVYVDGDVVQARENLFGAQSALTTTQPANKKRKRGQTAQTATSGAGAAYQHEPSMAESSELVAVVWVGEGEQRKKIRVVGFEFVVQSLIFGDLLE